MSSFKMEEFSTRAANNLYDGYKKGVFNGTSSFNVSTSAMGNSIDEHMELFADVGHVIFAKICVKFGLKPSEMGKIIGNRKWAHQIISNDGKNTKIIFKLFEVNELKKEKLDGALVLKQCGNCEQLSKDALKCGACKRMYYCNKECQKADWARHKGMCCKSL